MQIDILQIEGKIGHLGFGTGNIEGNSQIHLQIENEGTSDRMKR